MKKLLPLLAVLITLSVIAWIKPVKFNDLLDLKNAKKSLNKEKADRPQFKKGVITIKLKGK